MDDVFDATGTPPQGWMNALFDGGPYGDDVGRCVPGPPPPDSLCAGKSTYLLRTVGSWSAADNPIAVYGLRRQFKAQHPVAFLRHWFGEQRLVIRIKARRIAAKFRG